MNIKESMMNRENRYSMKRIKANVEGIIKRIKKII